VINILIKLFANLGFEIEVRKGEHTAISLKSSAGITAQS
jgi:hypothetical protein